MIRSSPLKRMAHASWLAPVCIVLAACSGGDAVAANSHAASGTAATAEAPAAPQPKDKSMPASKSCKDDNLHRAICMVELIMEDLNAHYDGVGGGGISQIKAESSTSYTVSLPQEERVDLITYAFEAKDGKVTLKSKTPSTQSF